MKMCQNLCRRIVARPWRGGMPEATPKCYAKNRNENGKKSDVLKEKVALTRGMGEMKL